MLSEARDDDGRPLLAVDVQLWLREVRRVLRRLDVAPRFEWFEGPCRCTARPWPPSSVATAAARAGGPPQRRPAATASTPTRCGAASMTETGSQRAWISPPARGRPEDPRVQWADGDTGELSRDRDRTATPRCPSSSHRTTRRAREGPLPLLRPRRRHPLPRVECRDARLRRARARVRAARRRSRTEEDARLHRQRAGRVAPGVIHRVAGLRAEPAVAAAPRRRAGRLHARPGRRAAHGSSPTPEERYAVLPPDLKEHDHLPPLLAREEPVGEVGHRRREAHGLRRGARVRTVGPVGRTLELTGAATAHVHVDR